MLDRAKVVRNIELTTDFLVAPPVFEAVHAYWSARALPYVSACPDSVESARKRCKRQRKQLTRKMPARLPALFPPENATRRAAPMTVGMTAMRMGSMRVLSRSEIWQTVMVVKAAMAPRGIWSRSVSCEV